MQSKLKIFSLSAAIAAACVIPLYGIGGFTTVEPGEYAIIIQQWGANKGVLEEGLSVGTHWLDPFYYDIENYDTKAYPYEVQEASSTKDGQPVKVSAILEVSLEHSKVKELHSLIGRNYYQNVIEPAFRAAIKDSIPTQLSDEVYTDVGRNKIQNAILAELDKKNIKARGINVQVNLQDIEFQNQRFVDVLEEKASAAQREEIERRNALAAAQEAIKVANKAEGEKQKTIKEAEAQAEKMRLEGLGQRQRDEEKAKGILALKKAEAEGQELLVKAYAGNPDVVAQIEWARNLGPNVKVYGVPTGAPGTTSIMDINKVITGAFAGEK